MEGAARPERPLRVVHLPSNMASLASHNVRALRMHGVDARGFVLGEAHGIATTEGMTLKPVPRRRHPWRWPAYLSWYAGELRAADIVHWYFDSRGYMPGDLDLRLVAWLRKPAVVQWLGSDIRIPEVEFETNPYFEAAWESGFEARDGVSACHSCDSQRLFAEAGFVPIVTPGMQQYIMRDLHPLTVPGDRFLVLSDYDVALPDPSVVRPRVVHAPSAPNVKGTPRLLAAVQRLRERLDFEFVLLQGMTRDRVMAEMSRADIVVDQLVLGDYGMAALEGMAFGKPVVCHVKPSIARRYPEDLPIVRADPDDVESVLEGLLTDGERRRRVGEESRWYVERHHGETTCAEVLSSAYRTVIEYRREGAR
ncbi:MAG TPA: glycosyltransferase [Coriobacteriia bacterium]|jgi:hypothetical protein